MFNLGRILILLGIIFICTGILFLIFPKIPIFRLPGDIIVKKDNFFFYFPVVSSILLSIILTIIFSLIFRK
uniref:DUF2905 family protein n=1 Tax=candidate division WOR-3 bacterium TaxID=2052148 RepID=A0A7C6AHC6_UNCW3